MRMRITPWLWLAVVGCAAKAPEATPTDAAAIRDTIERMDARQMQWIAQGAVDSMVTQYYAPDAVFLNLNQPAAVGTDAIRKTIDGFLAMGNFRFQLKTVSVQAVDSLASEYGTYTLELRPKSPADTTKVMMTDRGNYVTTFVRRNGQWRAIYDISVSDVPAPPAPPGPAKK